jgi:hypothetical protein
MYLTLYLSSALSVILFAALAFCGLNGSPWGLHAAVWLLPFAALGFLFHLAHLIRVCRRL